MKKKERQKMNQCLQGVPGPVPREGHGAPPPQAQAEAGGELPEGGQEEGGGGKGHFLQFFTILLLFHQWSCFYDQP